MKSLQRLPRGLQDLLLFGLGAYVVVGVLAVFANWHTTHRYDVLIVVSVGLLAVIVGEGLAAGAVLFIMRFLRDRTVDTGEKDILS